MNYNTLIIRKTLVAYEPRTKYLTVLNLRCFRRFINRRVCIMVTTECRVPINMYTRIYVYRCANKPREHNNNII